LAINLKKEFFFEICVPVFMADSSPAIPPSPHSYFVPGFPFYQVYWAKPVVLSAKTSQVFETCEV